MKIIVLLLIIGLLTPGMLNMIDWGLNFEERWWWVKLLLVSVFLIVFLTMGFIAYYQLWRR